MKNNNLYPEYTVDYISGCMSLRPPQKRSLKILADILEEVPLKKEQDLDSALQKVHDVYPTCTSFEREFMSLTFALATGVGKTRLMGAFITYLYTQKGVKNFFVVAPNLTIYNKLIKDLGDPNSAKYVFKGLGCFAQTPPNLITGENYKEKGLMQGFSDTTINVFNIAKFNRELGNIKKLSEYLGESYFAFLASKDDLCILMDESHHYRADKGMAALNELKPVLGMELTATPQVESGTKTVKFKNVVYEYSLAKALRDGFVKTPYALTRKDIAKRNFTDEEMDKVKLLDGVAEHENTKIKLELYARNNNVPIVKPFVLVVCKDTDHAEWVYAYVTSQAFYNGNYKDKVIIVHSNQKGMEKEENISKLLDVEKYDNPVEIVIHVNILKEGWDVNNLYTIIPLRTAASKTLREQTIGRGLRLPYGKKTGDKAVDALTLVSHDKFEEIVREANDPNSLLRQENVIFAEDLPYVKKEVTVAVTKQEEAIQEIITQTIAGLEKIDKPLTYEEQNTLINASQTVSRIISSYANEVGTIANINSAETKQIIKQRVENAIGDTADSLSEETLPLFNIFIDKNIDEQTDIVANNMIEIPRITISRDTKRNYFFEDFDLDTTKFNYVPITGATLLQNLHTNESEERKDKGVVIMGDTPENTIVSLIIDQQDIDYDICSDLLFKLVGQVLGKISQGFSQEEVKNIVQNHKFDIAERIYLQMKDHFKCNESKPIAKVSMGYSEILPHNYEKNSDDSIINVYQGAGTGNIASKIFNGFKKSSHSLYKFQSRDELNFAIVCERSSEVVKWLRPAQKQFNIRYGMQLEHQYEPDFVVESKDCIYIVEIKDARQVDDEIVIQKANAALKFCTEATIHTVHLKKKPWKYLIIPSAKFDGTSSFDTLAKLYVIDKVK
ncbi:MAG: DEAD/DEAH box helicase family protein [Clostridia bacterium]